MCVVVYVSVSLYLCVCVCVSAYFCVCVSILIRVFVHTLLALVRFLLWVLLFALIVSAVHDASPPGRCVCVCLCVCTCVRTCVRACVRACVLCYVGACTPGIVQVVADDMHQRTVTRVVPVIFRFVPPFPPDFNIVWLQGRCRSAPADNDMSHRRLPTNLFSCSWRQY